MEIASWGNEIFSIEAAVIMVPGAISFSSSLSTEAQSNEGGKPATYIKENPLETLSFPVNLRFPYVDVRQKIMAWRQYKDNQVPYAMIIGGKQFGSNLWLLKEVGISNLILGPNGIAMRADMSLAFEEYVRAGKKTTASGTNSKSTAKATRTTAKEPSKDEIDALFAAEISMGKSSISN